MSLDIPQAGGNPLRVVVLAAEMAPLAKVGGLADAVEGIAVALAGRGHRVEVILPGYGFLLSRIPAAAPPVGAVWGPEGRRQSLRSFNLSTHPVRISLLDDPAFSGRREIYVDPTTGEEYPEPGMSWGAFARGALELLEARGDPFDVLHVHDYHPALAPTFARRLGVGGKRAADAALVLTIHNAGYQGITDLADLARLGADPDRVDEGPWEFWGKANFLKAGTVDADAVTTVSPGYAEEISRDPEFGAGLEGVFHSRPGGIEGILNGIDTAVWDPRADPHLASSYSSADLTGKRRNKDALLAETGLDRDPDRPLAGMVTRLVDQKGIDLVIGAAAELLDAGLSLVVLGSGDPGYEGFFREWSAARPDRVFYESAFNDPLAHRIQAGADVFFMPSRYEPCGLTQLIALRYGTVPVVRRVGGLADTVRPVPPGGGESGTGFLFSEFTPQAFLAAVMEALRAFRDPVRWEKLVRRGMAEDFTWGTAAARYEGVYRRVLALRRTAGARAPDVV